MSILIAATVGCIVTTFLLLLVLFKFLVGLLYPLVTLGLVLGVHRLLGNAPSLRFDPRNYRIQYAIVVGGLLSVVFAHVVSGGVNNFAALGYSALVMAVAALLSILLEQVRVAGARRTADAAIRSAQQSRHLISLGEPVEAVDQLQEALLVCETAYGSYNVHVASIVFYMAQAMEALDRKLPTKLLLARAVGIYRRLGFDKSGALTALESYVEHLLACGELESALSQAQLLAFQTRKVHGDSAEFGRARLILSRVHQADGRMSEAYHASTSAVQLLEKHLGRNSKLTVRAQAVLAHQSVKLGRMAEGERLIREALASKEQSRDFSDAEFLGLLIDLCTVLERSEDSEAEAVYLRALTLFRTEIGPLYSRSDELLSRLPGQLKKAAPTEYGAFFETLTSDGPMAARDELQKHPELVSFRDSTGWTALQWAIFLGRTEIAERLISLGADHSVGGGTDYPPLFIAARWSRKSLIAALFRKDADIEIEAVDGSRPLHAAVRSGDPFTYDTIASRGAKLNHANARGWTPVHEAAYLGHRKLLIQLITKGGEVNFQGGTHRETPLHAAILGGQFSTAETLILNVADLQLRDSDDFTPLDLAESLSNEELVLLLDTLAETSGPIEVSIPTQPASPDSLKEAVSAEVEVASPVEEP